MKCKKCNSDHTQRLELVYESGTSDIDTISNSAGAATGGIGGATTSTTGTSQTLLSQKAMPPEQKSYFFYVIMVIFGWMLSSASLLWGGALIVGGLYLIVNAYNYNKDEFPPLYQHWKESWLCHKCGNIYHLPESEY